MANPTESNCTDIPVDYALFVGADWGDEKHALSLRVAGSNAIERLTLEQTPEALAAWINALRTRFPNGKIAVCLEQARGALLSALLNYEHIVAYPVNPKSLARFREAFYPSRTKNDTIDADLLLDLVVKHRDRLRPWRPDTEQTRLLALLSEQRRHFVNHRSRLTNELSSHLKAIFPQALDLVGENLASKLCTDFLRKWPTLQQVQKVQPAVVRRFYYGHNSRSEGLITKRLALIKNAVCLTTDGALLESHALAIQTLVSLLDALRPCIEKHDEQIAQLFAAHPDAHIFASLPGAGAALAPRLLPALGSDRSRFSSAEAISCYSGIAPVTEQSGKLQHWVHARWSCPKFLRQTWHEFANSSISFSIWAAACYTHMRQHMGHHAAVRQLAFKWQRIIWRMWQDRTPYDEARYLRSLQKRGIKIYEGLSPAPSKLSE
jgi:transposase